MGVITKITEYATEPTLDPDVGAKLDADIAQIIDELNGAIDNANIADTPKISSSKIDLTSGGFVQDVGDEITGILEYIFDGVSGENVWRKMRASGNARIYEGLADGLWCISYNTRYSSSAWTGRDVTGVCWNIKLESDGFHVYYAASDTSGVVPSWTEVFHINSSGAIATGSIANSNLSDGALSGDKFEDSTAGGTEESSHRGVESSALTGTYALVTTFTVTRAGTLRIKWRMKNDASTTKGKVYRNGSPVGTEKDGTSSSYVTVSDDVSGWTAGDTCEVWGRVTGGTGFINEARIHVGAATAIIIGPT